MGYSIDRFVGSKWWKQILKASFPRVFFLMRKSSPWSLTRVREVWLTLPSEDCFPVSWMRPLERWPPAQRYITRKFRILPWTVMNYTCLKLLRKRLQFRIENHGFVQEENKVNIILSFFSSKSNITSFNEQLYMSLKYMLKHYLTWNKCRSGKCFLILQQITSFACDIQKPLFLQKL